MVSAERVTRSPQVPTTRDDELHRLTEDLLADLRRIISSKRALDRPTDQAALPALEETLRVLEERGEV